jgi:hypothetical protein
LGNAPFADAVQALYHASSADARMAAKQMIFMCVVHKAMQITSFGKCSQNVFSKNAGKKR